MPTTEPKSVLSLGWLDARHPEQGATGLVWLISREQADNLKEEFTATYGKPVSSIVPGDSIQDLHDNPGFVLNIPDADPQTGNHFAVKVTDAPPTEIVCNCGVAFDGTDPVGDMQRHMEAEN